MSVDNPIHACGEKVTVKVDVQVDLAEPSCNHGRGHSRDLSGNRHRRGDIANIDAKVVHPVHLYDSRAERGRVPEVRRAEAVYDQRDQGEERRLEPFGMRLSRTLTKIGRTIEHGFENAGRALGAVAEGGEHIIVGAVRGSLGLRDNSFCGPSDHRWSHQLQSAVYDVTATARECAPIFVGPPLCGVGKLYVRAGECFTPRPRAVPGCERDR